VPLVRALVLTNYCLTNSCYLAAMALGAAHALFSCPEPQVCSRVAQIALNIHCDRVRAAEHAPRGPYRILERRQGLADIVERGAD
jgi:hypothetical protein